MRESKQSILAEMEAVLPALAGIVKRAFATVTTRVLPLAPHCTKLHLRWVMQVMMVEEARRACADSGQLESLEKDNRFLLHFNRRILINLRHFNENLRTAAPVTQAALDYDDPEIDLPGIPSGLRLKCGYCVNDLLGTELTGIYLTRLRGGEIEWFADITDADAEKIPTILPVAPYAPVVGGRIRPRKKATQAEARGKENE